MVCLKICHFTALDQDQETFAALAGNQVGESAGLNEIR